MSVSVRDAARAMGVSEQFVRVGIRTGQLPIGYAVQVSEKKRWSYYISEAKLKALIGGDEREATS